VVQLNNTTQIHINYKQKTSLESPRLIAIGSETATLSQSFDCILLDTLDAVLSELGCKQEIFHQLDNTYTLSRQNNPKNIKTFTDALECLFGEASAIIEIKLLHHLHEKVKSFKYYPKKDNLSLSDYLEHLNLYLNNISAHT
jgi:hypothetical protein